MISSTTTLISFIYILQKQNTYRSETNFVSCLITIILQLSHASFCDDRQEYSKEYNLYQLNEISIDQQLGCDSHWYNKMWYNKMWNKKLIQKFQTTCHNTVTIFILGNTNSAKILIQMRLHISSLATIPNCILLEDGSPRIDIHLISSHLISSSHHLNHRLK